jgi:tRNA 2-selenouridine synthase
VILPIDEFLKLRASLPVADVRSEKEFEEGHIPMAVNIPILNNEERIAVGTDYKQKGQAEAIKTGFRLVGPRFLEIINRAESVANGDELLVHCWRGGMRSSNFCQILGMAKVKTLQLAGGYKAYRERAVASYHLPMQLQVIGGLTGSGKSKVLHALEKRGEQIIDLEKLASHKGSVFGGLLMPPQPTTEQFQNELFEKIMRLDLSKRIWVEDESIAIGKIFLPEPFWRQMSTAPVYDVSADKQARVERLVEEYGQADKVRFLEAMQSIAKKLGGQHFKEARQKLHDGDMATTIEILLTYYDKAYGTGLKNKQHRIKSLIRWDGKDTDACARHLMEVVEAG